MNPLYTIIVRSLSKDLTPKNSWAELLYTESAFNQYLSDFNIDPMKFDNKLLIQTIKGSLNTSDIIVELYIINFSIMNTMQI